MTKNFKQSLIAVLAGNVIYYGVERYLPALLQHRVYQLDWGLAADFLLCLICYVIARSIR